LLKEGCLRQQAGWLSSGSPLFEFPCDLQQNPLEVFHNLAIFKPEHRYSKTREVTISCGVGKPGHFMVVRSTIQFNRNLFCRAIEIQNELAHAVLAAELPAFELTALEVLP
jgi:hypothetical protein